MEGPHRHLPIKLAKCTSPTMGHFLMGSLIEHNENVSSLLLNLIIRISDESKLKGDL